MKQLLASPLGSFIKAFVVAVLTIIVAKYNEGVVCNSLECLKSVGIASLFSTLPVIINYLNPNYTQYGTKSGNQTEGE